MSWEDQGRQYYMWFGHGTSANKNKQPAPDSSVVGKSTADRVLALAYGAIASLPAAQRRQAEAPYHNGTLPRLKEAMTTWLSATALGRATFAFWLFGRGADDPVVGDLHRAALGAAAATSQNDLRDAAEKVAKAMQEVGIDGWPRFVADAAERARDPATQAAIEKSRRPPDPARDAIRPVYPLETAIGVAAAGLAGRATAAACALLGAALKQVLPNGRLPTSSPAPNASERNAAVEKPANTAERVGEQAERSPAGQLVRLHEGRQGKHIEGSNNFDPTRSTLTADPKDLLSRFAGKGQQRGKLPVGQPGSKEAFDTGKQQGLRMRFLSPAAL